MNGTMMMNLGHASQSRSRWKRGGFAALLGAALCMLAPSVASAGSGVNPNLGRDVQQLIQSAPTHFANFRIDSSMREDGDGDRIYGVQGMAACGPNTDYNRIWHWRSIDGNFEYVCDAKFTDRAAANAYYDGMLAKLKGIRGFTWGAEQAPNSTTQRQVIGTMSDPPVAIHLDFDVTSDGIEVELWFKQTYNPGPQVGNDTPPSNTDGAALVSPNLTRQMRELARHARNNFSAIRVDSSMIEDGDGDRNYEVRGVQACGPRTGYNRIWHFRSIDGNWEYICDVTFQGNERGAAISYFEAAATQLRGLGEFKWEPVTGVNGTTTRRLVGTNDSSGLRVHLDFDEESDGTFEVELWFKKAPSDR